MGRDYTFLFTSRTRDMRPKVIVMVMMMVYAFSVASFAMSPSTVGLADDSMQTSTGVPTKVSVSAYPNGTSNA